MEIEGLITAVIYRNASNGYTVLSCDCADGSTLTLNGTMPLCSVGEQAKFVGEFKQHPKYGRQFIVSSYERIAPKTLSSIEAYLGSGAIKGIGQSLAKTIVMHFGMDTLVIFDRNPQRLLEIHGIGPKKLAMISGSYNENKLMREIFLALEPYGITMNQAYKLYKIYGDACLARLTDNPYQLIEDVEGIGFATADKIAQNIAGFEYDSPARLRAGIRFALEDARQEYGHTFLPRDKLLIKAAQLLGVVPEQVDDLIDWLVGSDELKNEPVGELDGVFLPYLAYMEASVAKRLMDRGSTPYQGRLIDLNKYESDLGMRLSGEQREAVKMALNGQNVIITGGPGTGKTTIVQFIVHAMDDMLQSYALCAPTGRAAKRMQEATDKDASTLHRLLEYNPGEGFGRNRDNPLEYDVVIVDEMSMVDLPLMYALMQALPKASRLVLIGDCDQLPPVGCGDIFRDIIESGLMAVVRLSQIFRQAQRSRIITNAHLINKGEMPILDEDFSDFAFESLYSHDAIVERVMDICLGETVSSQGDRSLQVLVPMKRGTVGVYNLNRNLQAVLNPPDKNKREYQYGDTLFREGDKVMQIKNNYKIEWLRTTAEGDIEGSGIYNGDMGTVFGIDSIAKQLTVVFDDNRLANYDFSQLDELETAYCISIHKSQGSEYDTVVLPLTQGPPMMLTRNLLYTAVTRAKHRVICVGQRKVIAQMVANNKRRRRFTSLCHRLRCLGQEGYNE